MRVSVASPPLKTGPALGSRVARVAALSALLWSGAAAAQTATAGFSVGATVVSSCTMSTDGRSASATVSCRDLGQGGYRVERSGPAMPAGHAGARTGAAVRNGKAPGDVAYVTITY
jgi:hypothetical protein